MRAVAAEAVDAVEGAPDVEHLDTRAIEARALIRGFVRSAEVSARTPGTLILATVDGWSTTFTDWLGQPPVKPEDTHGALRIDVVSDDVVRIRYRPDAGDVEEGARDLGIVVGTLPPPSRLDGDATTLRTPSMTVDVELHPFTVTIRDLDGNERCRIGGREKNEWGLWDTHATGVSRTTGTGVPLATETYALRPGEAVYGFGEQFGRLNKAGQTIDVNMVEAVGTTTPRAYKNIPFFWTTHGYGVFWNTTARITAWVGSRNAADIQIAAEDDQIDTYVFIGDPKTILDRYTTLTGKANVPPDWSFGWWQSKMSYRSAEEVLAVVRAHRAADLPIDVVHLDTFWFREDWRNDLTFSPERFPDPAGFFRELLDLGVRTCLWQLPYIPEGSPLFDELGAADAFVRDADGGLYDVRICYTPGFDGRVGIIDFTNPAAVEIYSRWIRHLHDLGAAAIKADFGEQAPLDGHYHDGITGRLQHNRYPLLYNRAIAEATHDATGAWIIWARSAWAGSQRYPLHWGGDSSPNWDNLGPQLAGGLSLGLSGFTFWSHDIGGFMDHTGGELLVRWLQAGLFGSHARIHGVGNRELADHGGEVLDIGRRYLHLRYRLLPYLLGEARRSARAGLPMMRALVVEFPDDPTTWNIDDQWLLGEHLLVAPILDATGRRRVYLPPGRWTDWWTDDQIDGPRWIRIDAPLDRLPLWIRDGGVIPLGPVTAHVGERPTDRIQLRSAPPADGRPCAGSFVVDGTEVDWTWDDGQLVIDALDGVTFTEGAQ